MTLVLDEKKNTKLRQGERGVLPAPNRSDKPVEDIIHRPAVGARGETVPVSREALPATRSPLGDGATSEESAGALAAAVVKPRRTLWKRIAMSAVLGAVLVVGGAYGHTYWQWSATHETTDDAFIDGHVAAITPRISGHVAKVYVSDNQEVKAGDLLVELDRSDYQAALDEANGKLAAANADLLAARSGVAEAQAGVTAAEAQTAEARAEATARAAEWNRAALDLKHYTDVRQAGVVSTIEWDKVHADAQAAEAAKNAADKAVSAAAARVAQAQSTVQARQGEVAVAQAQITAAQAAKEKARLDLSYTRIIAPADGRITKKSVEPGMFVAPGQMPALFALVSPDVWVTANFKETQLAHMKAGEPVDVKVDAYPGTDFKAHVDSIQQGSGAYFSLLPPENATGNYVKVVQRVPVKIVFENPRQAHLLGPGMSVEPVVTIK